MCRAFEETRNEKAIRIAKKMIAKGKLSLEEVAEYTELPLEKVQELVGVKTAWDEIMCRAFDETRNEASLRRAISIAKNMIEKGKYELEEIAEITELPLTRVQELAGMKTA